MRPRVSFILAVHGEQAYIEQCTQSVLGQGLGDIELIAVDDASHDHGPELLDSLAERDERVTVEHLAERVGPGAARNAGLDRARGDYLWFVETTDRLPAGGGAPPGGGARPPPP